MAQYDLIFEGGGAKGSTFVGALTAFYKKGHQARRLLGTSAGAITATLLAAGFTPEEMKDAVNEKLANGKPRFSSFMDKPKADDFSLDVIRHSDTMAVFEKVDVPIVPEGLEEKFDSLFMKALMVSPLYRQLFCFVECGGLYAGDMFLAWIKEKLAAKGFDPEITLGAFSARPEVTNELSLVASDTSEGGNMLVLNHRTAPNCPVAWAVRMSMSIPFVWREVVWQQEWGAYLGDESITGHIIVDGGVLSNFPIALVDRQPDSGSYEEQVMGDTPAGAASTLGFLIDESLPVPGQPVKGKRGLKDELKTVRRVSRLVDTMTDTRDNIEIRNNENLICRLPAAGYGTTEFDMDQVRLAALVQAGYEATIKYLS